MPPAAFRPAPSRRGPALQITLSLALAALGLSACSLAGDVTPPPGLSNVDSSPQPGSHVPTAAPTVAGAATALPPTPAPTSNPLFPAAAPVALDGGLLFLDHCAPCHGESGAGGGSMSAQLPKGVPDFSNPVTLRERTPQTLFATITQGRVDALMPPFGDTLTDAERWSLVAFLYTLSTPPEQLQAGQEVYAANCARCHGPAGQGDGPDAAGQSQPLPNFTDQTFMASRSQQNFFQAVSAGDATHPFTNLSDAQRWSALDAVRAFSYIYSAPQELTVERQGAVSGQVLNQTPGGTVPAGLSVTLHGFEGQDILTTLTTTIGADGSFSFSGVPFKAGRQFVATTEYAGVTYASPVAAFDLAQAALAALALTLPIYETTPDTSALVADQVHMFLEFNSPGQMTVGELVVFSNNGDRAYASTANSTLSFSLPAGATDLAVQDAVQDQTFFRTADGFSLAWTVPPGQSTTQVLFSFKLPYQDSLKLEQKAVYPTNGVNVLVSDLGLRLAGPSLQDLGTQVFQGQSFHNVVRSGLAPGDTFTLQITGRVGAGVAAGGAAPAGLIVGSTALVAALLGIGFWLYRRSASRRGAAKTREDLLQAIAELDDANDAGDVSPADYETERAQLLAELKKIWS